MSGKSGKSGLACLCLVLTACTSGQSIVDQYEQVPATPILPAPKPYAVTAENSAQAEHGAYMVELLGCGGCHTDGALIGTPDSARALAGSSVGIACSDPLKTARPCVVFPPNLTPHAQTGIGRISNENLKLSIKNGVGRHGAGHLKVMPIVAYSRLKDGDVEAIVSYLRSLKPIEHAVPKPVAEGSKSREKYVHFGVYWSRED